MASWKCPHCQGAIGELPQLVGQAISCPYCAKAILVPSKKMGGGRSVLIVCLGLLLSGVSLLGGLAVAQMKDVREFFHLKKIVAEATEAKSVTDIIPFQAGANTANATTSQTIASQPTVNKIATVAAIETVSDLDDIFISGYPETIPHLGISRDEVTAELKQSLSLDFLETTQPGSSVPQVSASSNGMDVTIWGNPGNIRTITLQGDFNDNQLATALAVVVEKTMPNWSIENAGNWFSQAINRCDTNTYVGTLRDNVELTMVASGEPGRYWIFFQRDSE